MKKTATTTTREMIVKAIIFLETAVCQLETARQMERMAVGGKLSPRQRSFRSHAEHQFAHAQRVLSELMGVTDVASVAPAATPTPKNKVPWVDPEMGPDWDTVQELLGSSDKQVRECGSCRQVESKTKASRPSKARK